MMRFRAYISAILAAIISCQLHSVATAQGHSIFDRDIPSQEDVQTSLQLAKNLSTQTSLTANEMLRLYYAEKKIGRCVWGPSPRFKDPKLQEPKLFGLYVDSIVAAQCADYVQSKRNRFRVVDDAWKGEENFWEPTKDLLERTKRAYPNSNESLEIEFDLEFNQFIRRFDIDLAAQGKTCDQYYKEELEHNGDVYREVYSEEDISKWVPECSQVRDDFQVGRKRLLDKYRNAPFTKKLQDIDLTTIIVFHSVC